MTILIRIGSLLRLMLARSFSSVAAAQQPIATFGDARSEQKEEPPARTFWDVVWVFGLAGALAIALRWMQAKAAEPPVVVNTVKLNLSQKPAERNTALEDLAGRDPSFDEDGFLVRARMAFTECLQAWSAGRPADASHLMSDGMLCRFLVELELNERHGVRNVLDQIQVEGQRLLAVEVDERYDVLHVGFDGTLRERFIPLEKADAATARPSLTRSKPFEEVWSFVRRRDPGKQSGHLTEGKCPSCGAPVERTAVATCEYCQAILNSGAHDWVLAEITESGDFFCRPSRAVQGWTGLRAQDPVVNRQVLEDRASLVFWKWIETRVTTSPERFARLCTPEAFSRLERCSDKPPRGFDRVVLGDGQLLEGEPDRGRAHLMLYWKTAAETWELPRKSMLTLERDLAVKTREDTGMATDRCHRCAGFQRSLDAVNCEWCGAVLRADWAFQNIMPLDEFYEIRHGTERRAVALAEYAFEDESIGDPLPLLASMIAMARADGVVREAERKLVDVCAERFGVPPHALQRYWTMPQEALETARPRTALAKLALMRALVASASADGAVGKAERAMLSEVAYRIGVDLDEVLEMIEEAKRPAQG